MKQIDVERLVQAIKKCFPNPTACDGILLVKMNDYNKLVEVVNELVIKETQVDDLP